MMDDIVTADEIHTIQKQLHRVFVGRMKGRPIPTQGTNIMNPLVLHAHLAIHNGIFGSIARRHLIVRSRNIASYRFYDFITDGHEGIL